MKNSLFIFVISLFFSFSVHASQLLSFEQKTDGERIIINVAKLLPNKVFTVDNPNRLVVDVPSVTAKKSITLPQNYSGKLIKSVRFGQFDKQYSRFVFDLNQPIKVLTKQVTDKLFVIDISSNSKVLSSQIVKKTSKLLPTPTPIITNNKKQYKLPLIAIDAGHGGIDSGTVSASGTQEKDVVLEYAKALREKLLSTGKYRVLLTRDGDYFIMLRKRVDIARRSGASLFISIHADSAEEDYARGLSVYTVSEKASDKEAEALANRENKSDVIGGMDLSTSNPDVADILISLAQRETKNNSAFLADLIVLMLGDRVKLLNNTHRFAGFAVLKAPDIPSVLVEIGFLSNPQEEKNLKSKEYREKVVSGIVAGVNDYFRKKNQ